MPAKMDEREIICMESLNMLKHFPLLLPSNNLKYWEGIINVMGAEIFFSITCPHFPSIRDIEIKCPVGFQLAVDNILKKVHDHNMSLFDVIRAVEEMNVLTTIKFNDDKDSEFRNIMDMSWFERYNNVLNEISLIGTENVKKTDGALTCISLKKEDEYGHEHTLDIKLPDNYPYSKPLLEVIDLPDVVLPKLLSCNSISEIYSRFCSVISSLQNFWFVYEELRRISWVIDPECPKKSDTYCRIMIGSNVSVLVTLNPLEVMSFPDIKFLGADKAVAPFRKALENNLKEFGWDMNNNLVDNLLIILGLEEFPQQPSPCNSQLKLSRVNQDDVLFADQECCICFMMRTHENMLPAKICNNDKCTSVVHTSCLAQWFQCVPTNEPSFNLISGDCPHCGKRILCPIIVI